MIDDGDFRFLDVSVTNYGTGAVDLVVYVEDASEVRVGIAQQLAWVRERLTRLILVSDALPDGVLDGIDPVVERRLAAGQAIVVRRTCSEQAAEDAERFGRRTAPRDDVDQGSLMWSGTMCRLTAVVRAPGDLARVLTETHVSKALRIGGTERLSMGGLTASRALRPSHQGSRRGPLEGPTGGRRRPRRRLVDAENPGAFLGLSRGWPEGPRLALLVGGVAVILVLCIAVLFARRVPAAPALLSLLVAGGLSNLIDRVARPGHRVVDFLHLGMGPARIGTFNVADVAIVAGAVGLAWWPSRQRP